MEKERIVFSDVRNVRLKKDIVFYCWFSDEDKRWWGCLSYLDDPDKLTFTVRGYTKEGLIANIEAVIRDAYNCWIIDEIDGREYTVYTFTPYFDEDNKKIEKKILPVYFDDIAHNYKKFEFRKNDEDYRIGDTLILKEWDGEKYTGQRITAVITYIIKGDELNIIYPNCIDDEYCIIGFEVMRYDCV